MSFFIRRMSGLLKSKETQNSYSLKVLIIWTLRFQFWMTIPTLEMVLAWESTRHGELPLYQVSSFDFLFS